MNTSFPHYQRPGALLLGLTAACLVFGIGCLQINPSVFDPESPGGLLLWQGAANRVTGPDINIRQGNLSYASGSAYDFGNLPNSTPVAVVFTVENVGIGTIALTGSPLVDISGTEAARYSITQLPGVTSLVLGSPTTFTLEFTPVGGGQLPALIAIANDDPDESTYQINLRGECSSCGLP